MTQLHAGGRIRPELVQGFRQPARHRRVGRQRALELAQAHDLGATANSIRWSFATATRSAPLAVVGDGAPDQRGTEVTFLPSKQTFTMTDFDFATLEHRLRELAFLNSGVTIVLSDNRHAVEKREEMRYEGGVEAFVRYLDRNKTALIPQPIVIKAEQDLVAVDCALWWNDGYHEMVPCFTNNIPQRDGGTHRTASAAR